MKGADQLQRGSRIAATPYTAAVLRAGGPEVWYEYPDYVWPTPVDREIADGEVLRLAGLEIRVLHLPGHTPGCAGFLVETAEGLTALTGDLLTGRGHPGWAAAPVSSPRKPGPAWRNCWRPRPPAPSGGTARSPSRRATGSAAAWRWSARGSG